MTIQEAAKLVKLEGELVGRYGMRSVLLSLATVAWRRGGAEWCFLSRRLREVVYREVPTC